jgi:type II secretory pathway pseudopilin PulG
MVPPVAPPVPGAAAGDPPSSGGFVGYAPPPRPGMSGAKIAVLVCGTLLTVSLVLCGGLTAVLLPGIRQSIEKTHRVRSANNLRQIGLAAMVYAAANQGRLPDDEKTIFTTQMIQVTAFLSPRAPRQRPPTGSRDLQGDWVNQHSDYVWTGANLNAGNATTETVLAYERPAGLKDGIEVLFGDGHVDWVPKPKANAMVSDLTQGKNPPPSLATP